MLFPDAQWLKKKKKICLPAQETQVLLLVQEDPTCHREIKPLYPDY